MNQKEGTEYEVYLSSLIIQDQKGERPQTEAYNIERILHILNNKDGNGLFKDSSGLLQEIKEVGFTTEEVNQGPWPPEGYATDHRISFQQYSELGQPKKLKVKVEKKIEYTPIQ